MRTTVLLKGSTAPLVVDARAGLGFHPAPDAQPGVHVTHQGTGQNSLDGFMPAARRAARASGAWAGKASV